ncbi:MAG: hypothetical protein ACE5D4_01870 [Thermodesulfobacteriota bacterium]
MSYNFQALADRWPSPIVARGDVKEFSGGVLNSKTLANLDSIGEGPPRGRMGRKVFYEVAALCQWMEKRAQARGA